MTGTTSKAWLDTYLATLNAMPQAERAEEAREHYREPTQIDQDYLDYVEEWQWHTLQQEMDLVNSTVRYFAANNLTVSCECGQEHRLALHSQAKDQDYVTVDSLCVLPHTQCWYRSLRKIVRETLDCMDQSPQTYHLPQTLVRTLTMVSRWRLIDMSQTPILLGLDAFRTLWWTIPEEQKVQSAKEILSQITTQDHQRVVMEHQTARSVIPKEKHRILLHFPHSDHGLHALITSLPEEQARRVFRFISNARANIDPRARISWQDLEQKISRCSICQNGRPVNKPTDFPQAVYYAPPGIGKTTLLNMERLIAVDTDWIGIGPTWPDYSTIFSMGISIITNQHTAFIGCGLKIIGAYNHQIRKMDGKRLTTIAAVERVKDQWPSEVFWIKTLPGQHLADYIQHLFVYSVYLELLTNACHRRTQISDDPQWTRLYPRAIKEAFL